MTTPSTAAVAQPLLSIEDLAVEFASRAGVARPVDGVSFSVERGEIVGLVGESGSGKSLTLLGVLGLIPPPGRVAAGRVLFDSTDLLRLTRGQLRTIRGNRIALIPADASASLNPLVRVGDQALEGIRSHDSEVPQSAARERVIQMFTRVGLPVPAMRSRRYPHELSGGMQQRVLIASALVLSPEVILADEPTTALDVTVQAQILRLLLSVRDQFGSAIVFVTHDLASVAEVCDRVLVMYAGQVVESAPVRRLFAEPVHPYTRGLIDSVPPLGREPPTLLHSIPGSAPDPRAWPPGCRFAPRCELRERLGSPTECETRNPVLRELSPMHKAACHFAERSVPVPALRLSGPDA